MKSLLLKMRRRKHIPDLLALLEISKSQGAVVAMEDRILKAYDKMRCGVSVHVLQAIHGG